MISLKNKAIKAMLSGDWNEATSLNKSLLKENPMDTDAMNRLSYIYSIQGRIKQAKTLYKKVLKIDPLNQIATRNIKKLQDTDLKSENNQASLQYSCEFLEEPGKTKIISLINTAQPKIIAKLSSGQPVVIVIKRLKIFIQNHQNQYLGVLPDDIGQRLIKLIKGGNTYQVYVKSAEESNISVFIKEIKRSSRYKNQSSFIQSQDHNFSLSKEKKSPKFKPKK